MSLLKLPNELLSTIFELTRPYAFENLVLTCKRIYSAAYPLLSHHNELRHKYRRFRFAYMNESPKSNRSIDALTWFVPQLLLDIARDPWVAVYIIHANLGDRNHIKYYRERDDDLGKAIRQLDVPDNRDRLHSLLRESWFLRSIGGDPDKWLECILEDDNRFGETCEFGLVFLMTLLVNVESLILPGSWSSINAEPREYREGGVEPYQYEVSQLMQFLVTLANDGMTREGPLKNLRQLLPSREVDTQMGMEMIAIAPFLSLQSMRDVRHASGKYICYRGSPTWDTMYPVIGPNIESLELIDYVIDVEASATFFDNMKNLKTFKIEYSMKDEIGDEWNASQFVGNLMSAVGKQLEVLSLRIGWMYDNLDPVTDLSGFTTLRKLELDIELLDRWSDLEGTKDPNADELDASILDMLPETLSSLKELRFQCLPLRGDVERLEVLLRDFGASKSLQLPNLEATEVYLQTDGGSSLRDLTFKDQYVELAYRTCREVGNITVTTAETWKDEEEGLQGISVHTRHGLVAF